jgi:hypothetical protein
VKRIQALASTIALGFFGLHCASEDPGAASESDIVENHPGSLVLTEPARAAFIEGSGEPSPGDEGSDGADVEVKGTGATAALTINGQKAEVGKDGSFRARIKGTPGLNLIRAADGNAKLESPFLFGHFVKPSEPVPRAIALDLGKAAFDGAAPATSLSTILNTVLEEGDLLAAIKGKTFSGDVSLATWSYKVEGARYAEATVGLGPIPGALAVNATVKGLVIDGVLTIKALGQSVSKPVRILAERANVKGDAKLTVDNGTLKGAMPNATADLVKFKLDSDNAGFPCCVDAIASTALEPMVEGAVRDGIREEVPKALALSLDGIGLPKELDLSSLGIKPVAIAARFDGATFDGSGGSITAGVLFGGPFPAGSPGVKAPGWLKLGDAGRLAPTGPIGISFAVDAVNQLLFTAWGSGGIALSLPDTPPVAELNVRPALPPVLTVADNGMVKIAAGEVLVDAKLSGKPITAAVTLIQDIALSSEGAALVLTPKGKPTISITWLKADDIADGVKDIVAIAVEGQVQKFLKPIKIPVPAFSLDRLGKAFAGQSLAIESPTIAVDGKVARVGLSGAIELRK